MKLLGLNIWTNKAFSNYEGELLKSKAGVSFGSRPSLDPFWNQEGDIVRIPFYPMDVRTLYEIAEYSDVVSIIKKVLKDETFRHGGEIKEKFANKCEGCGKMFKNPVDKCDNEDCPNPTNIREPDKKQKTRLALFLANCNENDQDITAVSKEIKDDIDTVDDGYMLAIKDYFANKQGDIIADDLKEIIKVHPFYIKIIADKTGRPGRDAEGREVFTCLVHRHEYVYDRTHCQQCGRKLFNAHFRSEQPDGRYIYYVKDEVCHKSQYKPSLTYGFSPILSVWLKITTLMSQDYYLNKYYTRQRPPRGMLFIKTPNIDSLSKMWAWMLDQFRKNPHMIPPIGVEGDSKGKFVEFIDFMRSLEEMQWVESRNEFRRQIGARYGVMPLFQADVSTSGGLNNEGMQITITNRAIEGNQKPWNDGFYPWLLDQLKITDYIYVLNPSEEKDEMSDEQLKFQKMNNARVMQSMGFEVTLNEEGDFEFEPTEVPVTPPQMGGQMPGMGGGGFGGMPGITSPPGASPSSPSSLGGGTNTPGPTGSPKKGLSSETKKKAKITAEEESKIILDNEKNPVNQKRHKFEPATWTHPNGHPRCIRCGDEESISGYCNEGGLKKDAVTSNTVGAYNPMHRRRRSMKELMHKILKDIIKEEKADYSIVKKDDMGSMADFVSDSLYDRKFQGISQTVSERIKEYIVRALRKGYPMDQIMNYVSRKGKTNQVQAGQIARTETQALSNKIREWAYKKVDPEGQLKYKWLNPLDHRTTDICRNLVMKTNEGVDLDTLKKLIEEESIKGGFKPREFTPHINCRSTFVRVFD